MEDLNKKTPKPPKSMESMDQACVVLKNWGKEFSGMCGFDREKKTKVGELFVWHDSFEQQKHLELLKTKIETVKVLYLERGKKTSLHFHKNKDEMFMVAYGIVQFITISRDGTKHYNTLEIGDRIFLKSPTPHQLIGINDLNILVEVSTLDEPSDSYRVERGD